MKALGLLASDKKIFENCILKTYFVTPWLTYATNQNHLAGRQPGTIQFWPQGNDLNNFGRGPLDDAIYQIWKLWAL